MADVKKIVYAGDMHFGWERVNGVKRPIHNTKAINAMMAFVSDFKPDIFVNLGDALDCGSVSHWNKGKRRSVEGLRLIEDAAEAKKGLLEPINKILPANAQKVFHTGNHEQWLDDLLEEYPGLEGYIGVDQMLGLSETGWTIIPQGGVSKFGKLYFAHGDTVGGKHVADVAVNHYERSIRFGHHHTAQMATKISALDITDVRTGVAVPCLCNRGPSYTRGRADRWINGFGYGYVFPDGSFTDTVVVIVGGRFHWNGRTYRG
jgi:hypothetical protein